MVGVGEGVRHEPNLRATQVELYDGLVAVSQNRWPNLNFDVGALNNKLSRLFPSGFYYKTFMWPQSFWKHVYEPVIRRAAGLGKAPTGTRPGHLRASACALRRSGRRCRSGRPCRRRGSCGRAGAKVIIADENPRFGGTHDISGGTIGGKPQADWVGGAGGKACAGGQRSCADADDGCRPFSAQLCADARTDWRS